MRENAKTFPAREDVRENDAPNDNGVYETFYEAIDPDIRDLVRLLRDNGINTTCSCARDGIIQFDCKQDCDASTIRQLLMCEGYTGFTITVWLFTFPNGWPRHLGELNLREYE